jgi:hypothetical protein
LAPAARMPRKNLNHEKHEKHERYGASFNRFASPLLNERA